MRIAATAPTIENLTSNRTSLLGPNLAYHLVRLSDRQEAEEDWGKERDRRSLATASAACGVRTRRGTLDVGGAMDGCDRLRADQWLGGAGAELARAALARACGRNGDRR
jgi:hypothetical protein